MAGLDCYWLSRYSSRAVVDKDLTSLENICIILCFSLFDFLMIISSFKFSKTINID